MGIARNAKAQKPPTELSTPAAETEPTEARMATLKAAKAAPETELAARNSVIRDLGNSNSWRITAPQRAHSPSAPWLLRNMRRVLTLAALLCTGQFRRAADALLPYYDRYLPPRVKAMIPDAPRQLVKRRPNSAIAQWRARLHLLTTSHAFEDAATSFERAPEAVRADSECRARYLAAAVNLGRTNDVRRIVSAVLSGEHHSHTARWLANAYPLLANYDGLNALVLQYVVAYADEVSHRNFASALRCAHDLAVTGRMADYRILETALERTATDPVDTCRLKLLRGQVAFVGGNYRGQIGSVNDVLELHGHSNIRLRNETAPVTCGNLDADRRLVGSADGPLVSILMPAFNSSATIGCALESLLAQTYRNIEVLVVDDASTDRTSEIVADIAARDPRVRQLVMSVNSGPFVAKNHAMAMARGEFVTNQDSDDWAHPEKVATAVATLLGAPDIIGTWVHHIRCSADRGFRPRRGYTAPDGSSLMFRKQVVERVGYYDSVRAGADGEYHLRIENVFGPGSIMLIPGLLSFVGWTETSISGGGIFQIDSDTGLFSPARSKYRRAFHAWHQSGEALYMEFPQKLRKFPVPSEMLADVGL